MKKWKLIDKKLLINNQMFGMYKYHLLHGDKNSEHNFFIIETFDWVNIIPITKNNQIVLVKQYRAGNDRITLEIPGGVMDKNETPINTAKRELEEETAFVGKNFKLIGTAYPNPAFLNNNIYYVLATEVEKKGHTKFDPSEYIETEVVPLKNIPQLIKTGKITHALVIAAFVYLEINGCCNFKLKS